jgi:hypothetical protein
VKLNCPACSTFLELSDNLAKKLVRCPKCEQSFVVPQIAPPLIAQKPNLTIEQPPDEYELGASQVEAAASNSTADPSTLKFCPGCGGPWKNGALECSKCHYVPALGAQIKPRERDRRPIRIDFSSIYRVLFVAALGYGGWQLFTHWNSVMSSIRSIFPN